MTLMADLLLGARGGGSGPRMPSWAPWQRCRGGWSGPWCRTAVPCGWRRGGTATS